MNFSFDFTSKTALVTSGFSDIGAATSRAFKRAGAEVIACGVGDDELAAARASTDFAGIEIRELDVTDAKAVTDTIAGLRSLDFVVNSAGIIRREAEHSPEVFDAVIDVNVSGGMRVTTAAQTLLAKSKGAVMF